MKIFDFYKIREPVLSIVDEILKDPSKHDLSLLSENHICLYFRKDLAWRMNISYHGGIWVVYKGDNVAWMTKREAVYFYKKLRPLYDDENKTREGWMKKVNQEV